MTGVQTCALPILPITRKWNITAFQKRIMAAGIPAYIRRPRGRDIYAACGQLKRTVEEPPQLVELTPA